MKLTSFWLMIVMATASLSCSSQTQQKMESIYANRPQVLEVLSFTRKHDIPSESVLESMQGFVTEMNQHGTLPRKVVANDEMDWISVNYWQDHEAKERINKEARSWASSRAFSPKIESKSFAMESYQIAYGKEEDELSKLPATVLEYVFMKKKRGVSDEEMTNLLHDFTPQMNQLAGLYDRVIAFNEKGHWVCINYWKSLQDMEQINAMSQTFDRFSEFPDMVEMSSVQLRPYFLRNTEPNHEQVIEIAVRSVKKGRKEEFETNRAAFIRPWMENEGAKVDREFESVFGMPQTDNEKFIGMTAWESQALFAKAGENPKVQAVAPDFMATFDMLAFVSAKPVEGDFNLAALVQKEGRVLELAIRRIKNPLESEEFHKRRKAYVQKLGTVEGVIASYELEVVMSGVGEHITVGMTEYANQAAVDLAGATVNQGPEAMAFLEVMEVVTFNYLKKVK